MKLLDQTKQVRYLSQFTLLMATLSLSILSASAELTPFKAEYKARFGKFKGNTSITLKKSTEDDSYIYNTYTKPKGFASFFGKIRESSTFTFRNSKVIPLSYSHKSRDQEQINYDWDKNIAESISDGKKVSLELKGSELDLLSMQVQLMLDVKNNSLKENYTLFHNNKLKVYHLTKLGEDIVSMGGKDYSVIKVKQQRKGSSRHSIFSLAPELDYAIIKMQQYKKNELNFSLTMKRYTAEEPETIPVS